MITPKENAGIALTNPGGSVSRRKSFVAAALCAAVLTPVGAAPAQACSTSLDAQALTGFEHGRRGFHVSTVMASGTGVSYPSDARTGAYALRVSAAKSNGYGWFMWSRVPAPYAASGRFALRLDQLPSSNVTQLFGMDTYESPRSTLRLGYDASSKRLKLTLRSAATGSTSVVYGNSTVSAGQWYVIDVRHDASTAWQSATWSVDGASQGNLLVRSNRAEPLYNVYLGTNQYDSFTASYDDLVLTGNAADYPIGDGHVRALRPNGSALGSGTLLNDDGTKVDSTSWQRLDDASALSTADFIKQTVASLSAHALIDFEDTDDTCIRAVRAHTWTHALAKGSNNAKLFVADGALSSLIKDGDWGGTGSRDYSGAVVPAGVAWTPEAVNGLTGRFGYSTDVSPAPLLDGVLLEYEAETPPPAEETQPAA
jgi:hypothetical protein